MKEKANIEKFNMELEFYVNEGKDDNSFWEHIRKLNCIEDFRWCFFMARHAYKIEKDINRATNYIELSLKNMDEKPVEIQIESIHDLEKLDLEGLNRYIVNSRYIYSLAGEIFSQTDKDKALYYYKLYHLLIMDMKPLGHLKYINSVILYTILR